MDRPANRVFGPKLDATDPGLEPTRWLVDMRRQALVAFDDVFEVFIDALVVAAGRERPR